MSVLPYQTIAEYCKVGLVEPYCERDVVRGKSFGLSHCGYDIRIKLDAPGDHNRVRVLEDGLRYLQLGAGRFELACSLERIKMPNDLVAIVHDKSSWARLGLALQNTVLEPGWEGYITLELTTHRDLVTIYDGDPIAQLMFHRLEDPTDKPYTGKYQNQPNVPVEAINEAS